MRDSSKDWLRYEKEAYRAGHRIVAGVDEAGRGPIAGPVVVAAAILPRGTFIGGIDDSKNLSPKRREDLYKIITSKAIDWSVGIVGHELIDNLNILRATHLAMREAICKLDPSPDLALIDGLQITDCPVNQLAIKGGDRLSQSIAAASILAKVTRDRIMNNYDKMYPNYGFSQHKGYPTVAHRQAVKEHGICAIHRRSFKPIKGLINTN